MENVSLAQIAKEKIESEGIEHIWYGNFDFCQQIANKYWGEEKAMGKHPLSAISMVLGVVSRSDLFYKAGRINHLGRWYPVFKLKEQ